MCYRPWLQSHNAIGWGATGPWLHGYRAIALWLQAWASVEKTLMKELLELRNMAQQHSKVIKALQVSLNPQQSPSLTWHRFMFYVSQAIVPMAGPGKSSATNLSKTAARLHAPAAQHA